LVEGSASVSLLSSAEGLSYDAVVLPTGELQKVDVSSALLGCVIDGHGQIVERIDQGEAAVSPADSRSLATAPVSYRDRRAIEEPFTTGIRAIDAVLSCGVGQRMGIFAAAGAGKTSLTERLLENAGADVYVVVLVGERGREVSAFVDRIATSGNASRTVIVQSTSDTAPAARCSAALLGTSIAEYFRDSGCRVLLVMDSMTRYARALRDVALASGEPPARRGYPASVFEALPRLVERPGRTVKGSITAFYTVLLEDEEEVDAIGEEVKSLLDGHIYLSSKLAGTGHYPAIDILRSKSRLFNEVATERQSAGAMALRKTLSVLEEMQFMRDLGEYTPGANPQNDAALAKEKAVLAFLRQARHERCDYADALEALHALAL
jgi:type III secretion protein N (ATPase)